MPSRKNWPICSSRRRKVAERLNAYRHRLPDGREVALRTKGIPGRYPPGPFSRSSVREVLLRRFYTGEVVYYGTDEEGRKRKRENYVYTAPGRHPALVSQDVFEQVQELRHFAARHRRNEQGVLRLYPLSGILRCVDCERRMWGFAANQGTRYYRDSTRAERRGDCEQKTVRTGKNAWLSSFTRRTTGPRSRSRKRHCRNGWSERKNSTWRGTSTAVGTWRKSGQCRRR